MLKLPPGGLTSEEKFVLNWLAKEDESDIRECQGRALTVLVNVGAASIDGLRVSVTDNGIALLKELREAGKMPAHCA